MQLGTLNIAYLYLSDISTHNVALANRSYWWVVGGGGKVSTACFVWPCFFIGVSMNRLSMFITGYHASLKVKPPSLLTSLGSSWMSLASFKSQST